jgi:hypothetical protein
MHPPEIRHASAAFSCSLPFALRWEGCYVNKPMFSPVFDDSIWEFISLRSIVNTIAREKTLSS